jgi:hypothetical protein
MAHMKVTECKVQLYLPQSLFRYLKEAARRKGASLSAYLRTLLREQVAAEPDKGDDPLLRLLKNEKGYGPRDGSRNVDKYLYGRR